MSSSFFEIHELSTGEIVLKRSDDSSTEPLVTIRFSAESLAFLGSARFEVAKAMIEAGMDAAGDLADLYRDENGVDLPESEFLVLH